MCNIYASNNWLVLNLCLQRYSLCHSFTFVTLTCWRLPATWSIRLASAGIILWFPIIEEGTAIINIQLLKGFQSILFWIFFHIIKLSCKYINKKTFSKTVQISELKRDKQQKKIHLRHQITVLNEKWNLKNRPDFTHPCAYTSTHTDTRCIFHSSTLLLVAQSDSRFLGTERPARCHHCTQSARAFYRKGRTALYGEIKDRRWARWENTSIHSN